MKALASNKKERHIPVVPVPRDDPNLARRVAVNARRAGIRPNSTAPHMSGAALPNAPRQLSSRTASSGGDIVPPIVDNYGNALSPMPLRTNAVSRPVDNGPTKEPFFKSFTNLDSSFTFSSATLRPSKMSFGSVPTLAAPSVISSPLIEPHKNFPTTPDTPSRSIFDVLQERASKHDTKTDEELVVTEHSPKRVYEHLISPVECSDEAPELPESAQISSTPTRDGGDATSPASPLPELPAKQHGGAQLGAEQPQYPMDRLVTLQLDQTEQQEAVQVMALTIYQAALPRSSQQSSTSTPRKPKSGNALDHWHSERMFFADTDGYTRLVDLTQTLYEVNVVVDDGASDFDSIASPFKLGSAPALVLADNEARSSDASEESSDNDRMFFADMDGYTRLVDLKQSMYDVNVLSDDGASDFDSIASPAKFDPLLGVILEELLAIASSDESDEGVDIDGLFESFSVDCTLLQCGHEATPGDATPNTALSLIEDEDVIDPSLNFIDGKVFMLDADYHETLGCESSSLPAATASDVDDTELRYDPMVEMEAGAVLISPNMHELSCSLSTTSIESSSDRADQTQQKFTKTMMDTEGFASNVTSYTSRSSSPADKACADEQSDPILMSSETDDDEATSSDSSSGCWVSELVRTKLGTESLFTFLENVQANGNGSTTKSAVVTTFLKLVSLEREKLGEHPLP
jgi:hypothetical protein